VQKEVGPLALTIGVARVVLTLTVTGVEVAVCPLVLVTATE
jgi:hypothetical protein